MTQSSQTAKQVEWCLRKAKKEIEEGKKHRGLVKGMSSFEEARKHIEKAEHNLRAIAYFNQGGFSDWSMSAGFYCIYHCFLAIALKFGYESRNQECTIALMKMLKEEGAIDIDDKFIEALAVHDEKERQESNVIEKREFYTYGAQVSTENDREIQESIALCEACLDETRRIVGR